MAEIHTPNWVEATLAAIREELERAERDGKSWVYKSRNETFTVGTEGPDGNVIRRESDQRVLTILIRPKPQWQKDIDDYLATQRGQPPAAAAPTEPGGLLAAGDPGHGGEAAARHQEVRDAASAP